MMRNRIRFVVLFSLLAAAGSAYAQQETKQEPSQPETAKQESGQPAPASQAEAVPESKADSKTFVIGPEDHLLIRVWKEPELSGEVTVRPDGKITMQLLGEIQAAGNTPEQLTQIIFDGLEKSFMKNPQVTVTVLAVNSRKYFIQGEVNKGGSFPLLVPTTVLEALVNAGGFREFADQKGIFVLRKGKRHKFNYKEVIKGKKMEQNILLEPGDLIVVP